MTEKYSLLSENFKKYVRNNLNKNVRNSKENNVRNNIYNVKIIVCY